MATTKELRGDVIERAANLETLIGAVISQVYFGKVKKSFNFDLLADEYCPFALKRRVLLKLVPELREEKNFEVHLNRLNTIRNYFAHVGAVLADAPTENANTRTPDPRDFDKSVDFVALHAEYVEKERPVTDTLLKHYKRLGGAWKA